MLLQRKRIFAETVLVVFFVGNLNSININGIIFACVDVSVFWVLFNKNWNSKFKICILFVCVAHKIVTTW